MTQTTGKREVVWKALHDVFGLFATEDEIDKLIDMLEKNGSNGKDRQKRSSSSARAIS